MEKNEKTNQSDKDVIKMAESESLSFLVSICITTFATTKALAETLAKYLPDIDEKEFIEYLDKLALPIMENVSKKLRDDKKRNITHPF